MGNPRSPRSESPRLLIDARTPDARAMGLRGVKRDISGAIVSGTDESGRTVEFPRPSMLPAKPTVSATAGMTARTQLTAPRLGQTNIPALEPDSSGMTTGHSSVTFPSPADRAARMNQEAQARFEAGRAAVFAAGRRQTAAARLSERGVMPQPNGEWGGKIYDKGGANPKLVSVYRTGSARVAGSAAVPTRAPDRVAAPIPARMPASTGPAEIAPAPIPVGAPPQAEPTVARGPRFPTPAVDPSIYTPDVKPVVPKPYEYQGFSDAFRKGNLSEAGRFASEAFDRARASTGQATMNVAGKLADAMEGTGGEGSRAQEALRRFSGQFPKPRPRVAGR